MEIMKSLSHLIGVRDVFRVICRSITLQLRYKSRRIVLKFIPKKWEVSTKV